MPIFVKMNNLLFYSIPIKYLYGIAEDKWIFIFFDFFSFTIRISQKHINPILICTASQHFR